MSKMIIAKLGAVLAVAISLGACAKHPDAIAATYVSHASYRGLGCNELAQENMRLGSVLGRASTQQENARTNDVLGILFIGVPVSTLSGDNIAPEIARLKGEQEALNRRMLENGCLNERSTVSERPATRASPAPRQVSRDETYGEPSLRKRVIPTNDIIVQRQPRPSVDIHKVMMHGAVE